MEDGYYVSSITFTANEAGTYKFVFNIDMTAGKSHVGWTGEKETTVIYKDPVQEPAKENNGKKLGHIKNDVPPGPANGFNAGGRK
ncbi:hypothetical protein [Bacillus sp. FJAT-44742]|uniref:hypothetical protein n=1 Tax=Bacillus sp. FJAT-44742 TaxID=2014005 RepID=UPI000C24F9C1|nr:hypothetical protein [Bacillus sp. FJAT-44742]